MAWAKNGTPDTLSSSASSLTISDLTAKKFNFFLCHALLSSGNATSVWTIENNTNTDYALRVSYAGGSDITTINDTDLQFDGSSIGDSFTVVYNMNLDSEEKLFIAHTSEQSTAGAGTPPYRTENIGKCDTTTNTGQYTRVDVTNAHASPTNYNTDSNLSVLTGNATETITLQDGTIFEETDTNKSYIWSSSSQTWTQL